ncbi:hypothetical protein PP740_gp004 [Stenotrophomonas phage Philippe]|uniref:Uncharacterized protein n=1 Tax=Stenotrophomonas phage Philippe TaxID=2859655 RepID=A0AAE8BLN4_9CAUD|nr:hypothetical protein PP740_gp004 [Stenotrophomonas phage Philippe]QYW02203.1 hypothetical protein CPT_Philippe_004 [Stenotrophomonas phage Philippe]
MATDNPFDLKDPNIPLTPVLTGIYAKYGIPVKEVATKPMSPEELEANLIGLPFPRTT